MNVSVVIPTRGNVDLDEIICSFPDAWEVVVYDNGAGEVTRYGMTDSPVLETGLPDLSVYARYAAIEYASHDLILTQDDDVIVSDPQAIVDEMSDSLWRDDWIYPDRVVCNMPQEFRHDFYRDNALVGFGAAFHRDAPKRAFDRFGNWAWENERDCLFDIPPHGKIFYRDCDRVFTCLTPRVLVDIPKTDREFASDPDRLWKQPDHIASSQRMLDLARRVRDA